MRFTADPVGFEKAPSGFEKDPAHIALDCVHWVPDLEYSVHAKCTGMLQTDLLLFRIDEDHWREFRIKFPAGQEFQRSTASGVPAFFRSREAE